MTLPDPAALLNPYARHLLRGRLPHVAAPRHARLLSALRRLVEAGETGAGRAALLDEAPGLAPHVALLERCAAHLDDVLADRVAATEVLFPGGSAEWVQPIYRGNPWSDHFNALTARAARRAVDAWRPGLEPGGRVQVLEVGAGTGGTTAAVLEALDGQADAVAYQFTDVSPGFVQAGLRLFARPYLTGRVLDLERDPAAQGQQAGSQHLVIATNVLHATADIAATLDRLARLLRPGGLLLVNELTRTGPFATATFGLLDGWWAARDPGRREPDSPLLSVAGWGRALTEAGFGSPRAFGLDGTATDSFQALLVAERRAGGVVAAAAVPAPVPQPQAVPTTALAARVAARLAAVLGLGIDEVPHDRPFAELGVDSIVAPQLIAALNAELGTALVPTDVFNHATVADLAARAALLPSLGQGGVGGGFEPGVETSTCNDVPRATGTSPTPGPSLAGRGEAPAPSGTDIAVIGLACRFPGAPDADAFWDAILAGRSAVRPVPPERWDWRPLHAADRQPGRLYAHWGAFLEDHDRFDPEFFNLTWREAEAMSPQQRVFLQTAWHALEDAGYAARALSGLSCGVFVGVAHDDYAAQDGDSMPALGNSVAILPARLSYLLNLRGPALPIDTACSSSLVAIHMACQSLLAGDSDMALAGGVSILLTDPRLHLFLSDSGMASPTGQCRTFDAAADGFVPGEGAGIVVLKRHDRALADGDRILGVIRASGVNQDGRTSGITAPSGPAQTALERAVWAKAGIAPASIGYVEAHGTGTQLGDPIEVNALRDAMQAGGAVGRCAIGSVKTNVGHTLTAAGVAGLIKVLLSFRAGVIPPSLNFSAPNPQIDLVGGGFHVPVAAEPWPPGQRRAAVSSFGFSGTNAHLVVDAPMLLSPSLGQGGAGGGFEPDVGPSTCNDVLRATGTSPTPGPSLAGRGEAWAILLSGRSAEALERAVAGLAAWLDTNRPGLQDLAFTLAAGRTAFEHRLAFVVDSVPALRAQLASGAGTRGGPVAAAARPGRDAALAAAIAANAAPDVLAARWAEGGDADWTAAFPGARRVAAPLYPFARERFWRSAPRPASRRPVQLDPAAFPLADHVFAGRALLPAAAILDLVVSAALEDGALALPCRIEDVSFLAPLYAPAEAWLTLDGGAFELRSEAGLHASGRVAPGASAPAGPPPVAHGAPFRGSEAYAQFAALGFEYGPALRAIDSLHVQGDVIQARLLLPAAAPAAGFTLHPALLDGAIQAAIGLALGQGRAPPGTVVPMRLAGLEVHAPLTSPCTVELRREPAEPGIERLHLRLWDAAGTLLATAAGFDMRVQARPAAVPFYAPRWTPGTATAARPELLFDEGTALWEALGRAPALVQPGSAYARSAPGRYTVRPASREDHAQLLRDLGPAPATIWHCWSRTAADETDNGPLAMTQLVRALLARTERTPVRLVHAHDGSPFGRMLGGLARAIAREQSAVTLAGVAAPPGVDSATIALLEHAAPEAATWHGVAVPDAPSRLRRGGTYLVTGGLGGIGAILARHLARAWDARLVLLGRGTLDPARQATLDDIAAAGGEAMYLAADVADPAALDEALATARARFGPIHGVIHAAGVQRDGLLRDKPDDAIRAVLAPKVAGTINLDRATAADPLEFFASFSSVAAAFGSLGQADYAAANAFLDAHAASRGGPGRSLSIGWPFWRGGGMDAAGGEDASATGIRPLEAAEGCAAFEAALLLDEPHVLPLPGDQAAIRRFLDGSRDHAPPAADTSALDHVLAVFARATGMPVQRLDPDKPFEQYGVDSILVMKLNAELERDLGKLPKTLLFDHPNLRSLAAHLGARYGERFPAPEPAPAPPPDAGADAIAVIGIAGRFPEAATLEAFWDNLRLGRDVIRAIPPERWDHAAHTGAGPGQAYARWGGFVPDVDRFDPLFFAIAPNEADRMDPQERLFLEVCWQAMEDAGYTRAQLAGPGRAAGVYVGVMYGDYQLRVAEQHARGNPVLGASSYWSVANRVSYVMDLHGPSMAVDTACSSSLNAIHLACQALAAGEVAVAIAGGVNLSLHPLKYVGLSQGRFASTDGRCRSFAEGGDGYVPGEGVGAVILKPLRAARADGDYVHAVIRGWSANHGGKTNGYTVPSPAAQAEVIRAAVARSGVPLDSIGFIEAHGTGTALGDPIEIAGLAAAYGEGGPRQPCRVGSAKASIGHLEAAAGIAGLAKLVLQFRHRAIPPMPAFGGPNPNIDFEDTPFRVQHTAMPWDGPLPLRAGLSSFGAGGANAHLVVEEGVTPRVARGDGAAVFVLSARTRPQLEAQAGVIAAWLDGSGFGLSDICHTLQHGREAMAARLAFACETRDALRDRLAAFAAGQDAGCFVHVRGDDDGPPPAPSGRDPASLAAAWVRGAVIAWPATGQRVPLPPRAFLGRRHWIAEVEAAAASRPHPELDRAVPSLDGAVFARRFTPSDPLVRDHVVRGRLLLPGAAQLMMALAAAGLVQPGSSLADIVWQAPVLVPEDGIELHVRLWRDAPALRFEVTAGTTTHATGRVVEVAPQSAVSIPDASIWPSVTQEDAYARLAALGLAYGPALALLRDLRTDGHTVLARLAPGNPAAVIDAAFQSMLGLAPPGALRLQIPFALAAVHAEGPLADAHRVVVRRGGAEGVFDLVVIDAADTPLLRLTGLATRPVAEPVPLTAATPVWRPAPGSPTLAAVLSPSLGQGGARGGFDPDAETSTRGNALRAALPEPAKGAVIAEPHRIVAQAETTSHLVWLASASDEPASMALDLLHAIQALDRAGRLRRALRLTVVTRGLQRVAAEAVDPAHGPLAGVAKVAALEFPNLAVALVDMDAAALARPDWLALAAAEPAASPVQPVAWRGLRRFVLALEPAPLPQEGTVPRDAVWLIVGGGGGLGLAFADWLARTQGARVALVGRRPIDPARLAAMPPGRVRHHQADAADPAAMARVVTAVVAEWGQVDCAIQAALVLRDAGMSAMDDDTFHAALAPKVAASLALEAALAEQPLRLMVLFSSANAYPGSAGQANYVAGSCFADGWARRMRATRPWRTVTINWGLWGEIGAVRASAFQDRLARMGVHPILPAEGLDAFARILASGLDEVVAVKAEPAALRQLGVGFEPPDAAVVETLDVTAALAGFAALERAGRLRLRRVVDAMAGGRLDKAYTPAGLIKRLGIAPRHATLFAALLQALLRDGLAVHRDNLWRFPDVPANDPVAVPREPWLVASAKLLDACLDRYPELLRGTLDPVAVIFPGADMALVQAAYSGNPVGDAVNAGMAAAAAAQMARVAAAGGDGPARMIEIGGGSGASTQVVAPALAGGRVEYVFSDVSPRFLAHAEARFAQGLPGMRFALFDAEREADANGVAPGSFDAVLAANVLHATGSLRATLARMARLLRPGGVLIVNELTRAQDFATIVFGLTEGWWAGAAEPGRLPGSPLAGVEQWRDWLLDAGFATVRCATPGDGPQSLITATMPGLIQPTLSSHLPGQGGAGGGSTLRASPSRPLDTSRDLPAKLRQIFADVLRVEPGDIRLNEPFDRYGLESLTALDIRNRLEPDFPGVPATLLFEHDTLGRLVAHLEATYPEAVVRPAAPPPPAAFAPPRPAFAPGAEPAEPIAIIGFSARLPGGPDPAAFWRLLEQGGQAITEVPADRWDVDAFFDPAGGDGRAYTKWGGFIEDVDRFDPLFFNISPLEAESMDPQERLFLQTAWAALEAAGTTPRRLSRMATEGVGVFVGVMNTPYQWLAAEAWRDGHANAGASHAWSIANRVSYLMDFSGPSLAVDTACSASLTALHLACESLRRRECGAAIAGGVNLILHPRQLVNLSAARMLSRGAECRAFGAGADGFVDGEGVGAVLLKPLAAAERDGDRIEAVILGSAVNAGGRTAGFTVPNPAAQGRVVRQAMARAGVPAESIGHIETHGTGTSLGDPIEIAGLAEALGRARGACTLGALKANIGHLESAAGIAGLVKLLLQFRHRRIAPHPFAATPNPLIPLDQTPFTLPPAAAPWEPITRPEGGLWPRRAGLSSFGAGGANAHLVVEEYAAPISPPWTGRGRGWVDAPSEPFAPLDPAASDHLELLPLSARDEPGLVAVAQRLAAALTPDMRLADIAHTLRLGRVPLARRAVILAASLAEFGAALAALAEGRPAAALLRGAEDPAALTLAETPAGQSELATLLAARDLPRLAALWCAGADIEWEALSIGHASPIELPTYPFARERHWLPAGAKPAPQRPVDRPTRRPADPPDAELRVIGRAWRAVATPAARDTAGTLLVLAPTRALGEGIAAAWPGPHLAATMDEAVVLLGRADAPLVVAQALDWEQDAGLAPTFALTRAAHARTATGTRLLHLHRSGARPLAEAMGAFARSSTLELPGGGVRAIRVEGDCTPAALGRIVVAEGLATDAAAEVLYRGGTRHVPSMARLSPAAAGPIAFRLGGAYLLPGGLGEVGHAIAERLVRRYNARIGIIGRRPAVGVVSERLAGLRALGDVHYARADIADPDALAQALTELGGRIGPWHGVLQMATGPVDGLIGAKPDEAVARVLRPKIAGTLALDAALAEQRLDWFVACASVAGWHGLAGGADYAYACAWQAGFAAVRQAMVERGERHGRSLSIAWPQWRHDRHLGPDKLRALERVGVAPLETEDGLRLLELALHTTATDVFVVRAAEKPLQAIVAAYDGTLPDAPDGIEAELAQLDDAELERYVDYLRGTVAPAPRPGRTIEAAITEVFGTYLKIPAEQLRPDARFETFGLDSIKALHVAERLSRRVGVPVDPAMFYEHPTIALLAAAIESAAMQEAGQ